MKRCPRRCRIHWRVENVVRHLRGRSDHHDLVLEKRAIGIIGMPKFRIEDFVERARFERVGRGKTNHVTAKIARDVIRAGDFHQRTRGKRFVDFLARVRRQIGELAIRHAISSGADFSVDRVRPEIHETDTIVEKLRRWN